MWSDRLSDEKLGSLVERLRAILPAPGPDSRGATTPLRVKATPEQAAEALRSKPGFIWLDGGRGGHRLYSRPLVTLSLRKGKATVTGPGGPGAPGGRSSFPARGFDLLEAALAAWGAPGADRIGGFGKKAALVGYLGYELAGELEQLPPAPPDELNLPDLYLALYAEAFHWDGQAWTLESTDAWRDAWQEKGAADPVFEAERLLAAAGRRELPAPPEGRLVSSPVTSRPRQGGFEEAVQRSVERIHRGELCQVNLCRRLQAELPAANLWPLYRRLRAASPADHGAYLSLGRGKAILSVSPELYVSVRDGIAESRPIKGTRRRGATPREDRALARELEESAKDRAELAMIVDVTRNDLGRVCLPGTVEVVRHAEMATLPTLHHTVSTVRGKLRPGNGPVELLRAAFPPASITGAPKIRAMTTAMGEEEHRRGPAMGAIGWISLAGDLELSVAIRTAAVADGKVVYHAGCGIVADSDPEQELEESAVKARAFLTALGAQES